MDINNGIIKLVRTLEAKKHRDDEGLWVAEGTKCVRDTWGAFKCRWLICTRAWFDQCGRAEYMPYIVYCPKSQMSRMSQFTTPSDVIAVYEKPDIVLDSESVRTGVNIVLDNLQDPGNLGTIIRLADWFGIDNIFASQGTVDVFNHKVVQATMGAISRVKVHYGDLDEVFDDYPDLPVYGTFLDGENLYSSGDVHSGKPCFVVFGNEGQGIGRKVAERVTRRITIPAGRIAGKRSESLNVGVAAAITISELMKTRING